METIIYSGITVVILVIWLGLDWKYQNRRSRR